MGYSILDSEFRFLKSELLVANDNDIYKLFEKKYHIYLKMAKIGLKEKRYDVYLNYNIYASIMLISKDICVFPFTYLAGSEIKHYYLGNHEVIKNEDCNKLICEIFKSHKGLASWLYNFTTEYILQFLILEEFHKYFSLKIHDKDVLLEIIKDSVLLKSKKHIESLTPYTTASNISGLVGYELSKLIKN